VDGAPPKAAVRQLTLGIKTRRVLGLLGPRR
jgi:hypothetical protein